MLGLKEWEQVEVLPGSRMPRTSTAACPRP